MTLHDSKISEKRTFKLKPLSKDGIEGALDKAEHYRSLNQPRLAESICLDILEVDASNQKAKVFLLLALTDQFGRSSSKAAKQAHDLALSLKDEYSRNYYEGIVHERQGAVALNSGIPGSDFDACEWYLDAMKFYEKAEALGGAGNNDPVLRWNTCARIIMQFNLQERPADESQTQLE
jgi:hypothetical protein